MNGWLSVLGAGVVLLLLAPNAASAWRGHGVTLRCANRAACALEQVGRYGCIACMALNFKPLCGGFPSSGIFVVWAVIVPALILLYWGLWVLYARKPQKSWPSAWPLCRPPSFWRQGCAWRTGCLWPSPCCLGWRTCMSFVMHSKKSPLALAAVTDKAVNSPRRDGKGQIVYGPFAASVDFGQGLCILLGGPEGGRPFFLASARTDYIPYVQ